MNRTQVLSLLAGVILIFLCCCSGLAARVPRGPIRLRLDLQAPSLASLRSRMTQKIHGGDLALSAGAESGCAVQGNRLVVPAGARCEFAIPASSFRTRRLVLSLPGDGSGGASVAVRMDQELDNKNPMTVDQPLARGGDPLALDVYGNKARRAAKLTLQGCALIPHAKSPCAVEIQ